jgi:hypothetical protein
VTIIGGVDIGTTTGVAFWARDGLVWSAQGSPTEMTSQVIAYARQNPIDELVLEEVYVGPSPKISLGLEYLAGFTVGALWACGMHPTVTRIGAEEWRKVHRYPKFPRGKGRSKAVKAHARVVAKQITGRGFADEQEHEAEAILIARARWIQRFEEPGRLL